MDEPSPTEQWRNLVRFAVRNEIPELRVTPAQHRAIKRLPRAPGTLHPYALGGAMRVPTLFGHPLVEVPEGADLATAVERASLGPARLREEN